MCISSYQQLLLGVQINSMLLLLINFRKFIKDEKWILCDNFKRRKS